MIEFCRKRQNERYEACQIFKKSTESPTEWVSVEEEAQRPLPISPTQPSTAVAEESGETME